MVAGVGISLPAPVDHRIGRVFGPSILIGWDDFPIGDWLSRRFEAPAVVENDVNLMTVFEHRRAAELWNDHLGRVDRALWHFQQAWKLEPHRTEALEAARQLYLSLGDDAEPVGGRS